MTPNEDFEYWVGCYKSAKKALEVAQKNLNRISKHLGNVSMEDMVERGADSMLAGTIEPVVASDWPQCPQVDGSDL